ncbi:MAG TPA: ATP-dependent DNA ligase [Intrasporangiaceae bacterium]|nr:ATP-dependent DNA ligase [Intrasporangiaceae bacterium]
MLLSDVVDASRRIGATSSRIAKRTVIADAIRSARTGPEAELAALFLSGTLRQRRTGIGWRSLATVPIPAAEATLTISEVDHALQVMSELSGPGSTTRRREHLDSLFGRATGPEQRFLRGLITGEIRQGALDGVLLDALADAFDVPAARVRRAAMLGASSAAVARALTEDGISGLDHFALTPGRPVRPMLAASAPDVATALETRSGEVAVDGKLDGIRVQAHLVTGDDGVRSVTVFTRSLDDITHRLPEVVEAVEGLPLTAAILDGEALVFRAGRPVPFQDSAARTASSGDVALLRQQWPLTVLFFDALHLDGRDLIDRPARERFAALEKVAQAYLVPRIVTTDPARVQQFADEMIAAGHEGIIIKDLESEYAAGRRGAGWVKVKPRHTLDLVVLAVEWGSGRRTGLLSNIHLGARDPSTGGFVMLGKTFKGMTDEMLTWQTRRFLELERSRSRYAVHLRPEQVVEIAFDGLQRSRRYPGGVALRFARVVRYRDDKTAADADTIDTVLDLARRTGLLDPL